MALLNVLMVTAGVLAIVARGEHSSALQQRDVAEAQRVLEQATAMSPGDPATAEQLALAAYRLTPTQQTASGVLNTLAAADVRSTTVPGTVFAVSPDGRLMVLRTPTGAVQLWTLTTGHARAAGALATLGTADPADTPVFSPDGHLLLLHTSHSVELWSVANPARPTRLATQHGGDGIALRFAHDHTMMIGNVVWDITDPRRPVVLNTVPTSAAFGTGTISDDGHVFADTVIGRGLQLWDLSRPHHARLAAVERNLGLAGEPALHGSLLAVVEPDQATVQVWNTADVYHPELFTTIHSQSPGIVSIAFNPAGTDFAATVANGMVESWDIGMPAAPAWTVQAPDAYDPVDIITFSTDEQLITVSGGTPPVGEARDPAHSGGVASPDTIQWLDVPPDALTLGSRAAGYGPAYSPDGHTLTTVGGTPSGGLVTNLWDVARPRAPRPEGMVDADTGSETVTPSLQAADQRGIAAASFSRSRKLMVTSSGTTARLWDVRSSGHPSRWPRSMPIGRSRRRPCSILTAGWCSLSERCGMSVTPSNRYGGQWGDRLSWAAPSARTAGRWPRSIVLRRKCCCMTSPIRHGRCWWVVCESVPSRRR